VLSDTIRTCLQAFVQSVWVNRSSSIGESDAKAERKAGLHLLPAIDLVA
jgi:hypothetical protein